MKKGQSMPLASREKTSKTILERSERRRIGADVVRLLMLDNVKEAKKIAEKHRNMFIGTV